MNSDGRLFSSLKKLYREKQRHRDHCQLDIATFKKTIKNTSPKRQRVNESQSAHSLAFFEVALFDNQGDQQGENTGDYHNPTRHGVLI